MFRMVRMSYLVPMVRVVRTLVILAVASLRPASAQRAATQRIGAPFFENRDQGQSSWGSQGRTSIPPPLQKENYRSGEGFAIWGLPGEVGGERVLGDSKERRDALPLLTLRNPGLSARPVI